MYKLAFMPALPILVLLAGCAGSLHLQKSEIVPAGRHHKLVAVTLQNKNPDDKAANIRLKIHDRALAETRETVSKDGKFRSKVTVQAPPVMVIPLDGVTLMPGETRRCLLPGDGCTIKAKEPLIRIAGYDKK